MERRRAAAAAFDQVIAEIRGLPGFRGFLRPPPVAELLAAAAEGPVVVVTVSRFGSHALILTGGGVLDPVPLPGLTPQTVYDRVAAFLGALEDAWSPAAGAGGRAAAEQRLGDTLGWLWDALAGPVLGRLGITGPPRDGQPWPRLWWCVSGLLSFLPVHAAGHHDTRADAAPATVMDRVISSYTPTLRALTHARRPGPATAGGGDRPGAGDRVVAVAMPHTPGASDLPGAQAEAAGLQRRFPGRVTVLTGPQATHDGGAGGAAGRAVGAFRLPRGQRPGQPVGQLPAAHRPPAAAADRGGRGPAPAGRCRAGVPVGLLDRPPGRPAGR